jgi:hypothetical protein
MHKSTDGGKTFTEIPTPHGDNHDLWIDPRNNQRLIEATTAAPAFPSTAAPVLQHHLQPVNGPVLPHLRRRPIPLPRLRHAAGQLQRLACPATPSWKALSPWSRLRGGRHGRERLHRGQAGRREHRLRGRGRLVARRARLAPALPTAATARFSSSMSGRKICTVAAWARRATASRGPSRSSSRPTTRTCSTPAATSSSVHVDEGNSWQVISPDLTRGDP